MLSGGQRGRKSSRKEEEEVVAETKEEAVGTTLSKTRKDGKGAQGGGDEIEKPP